MWTICRYYSELSIVPSQKVVPFIRHLQIELQNFIIDLRGQWRGTQNFK